MRRIWIYVAAAAVALTVVVAVAVVAAQNTPTPPPAPGPTVNPVPVDPAPDDPTNPSGPEDPDECLPLEHGGFEGECDSVQHAFDPDPTNWALTATATQFVADWFRIDHHADAGDPLRDKRLAAWMADNSSTATRVVEFAHGQVGMTTTAATLSEGLALPWPAADGERGVLVTVNIRATYTAPEQGAIEYLGAAQAAVYFNDDSQVIRVTETIRWLTRP